MLPLLAATKEQLRRKYLGRLLFFAEAILVFGSFPASIGIAMHLGVLQPRRNDLFLPFGFAWLLPFGGTAVWCIRRELIRER